MHLEGFGGDEAAGPHDQLGAAFFVVSQMQRDLAVNHVALALAHFRHVGRNRARFRTELGCMTRQMRDPGAPNLILARKAGDVGTGAADPPALDDDGPPPRSGQMPSEQLPAKSAAQDQNFNLFWLGHDLPPYTLVGFESVLPRFARFMFLRLRIFVPRRNSEISQQTLRTRGNGRNALEFPNEPDC